MQLELMHHTLVRWNDPDPKYIPLLRDGGVTALVVTSRNESFDKACADAGIQVAAEADLQFVGSTNVAKAAADRPVVFQTGKWPGIQRPDPQSAGATHSLWMDQNCWLVQYLKARQPNTPPVLGYRPDADAGVTPSQMMAYDALELALVDAWVAGGNYLMDLHPRFREALLKAAPDATAAWIKTGKTAKWLRANEAMFRQSPLPIVTVLVNGDMSQEIASLSYRQNVSPALVSADTPPSPDPARVKVLVAVGVEAPSGAARDKILANAGAGTTLVVDGAFKNAWWRTSALKPLRTDAERTYYSLGKGQVVAYKEEVEDPGMVALDLIDFVTQKRRAARIWNCNAGILMATAGIEPGSALLHVMNYSRPQEMQMLAQIQGRFRHAVLMRPDGETVELKVSPRGSSSEVAIPRVGRIATVVFSGEDRYAS